MNMKEWAKREVELACAKERSVSNNGEEEWQYGCACYESALKAFDSLCEEGHSGFSIRLTKSILDRLIDGKPLTQIEDTDDVWDDVSDIRSTMRGRFVYQCKRMSSLFKYTYTDGTTEYRDVDRIICVDAHDSDNRWYNGKVCSVIDELMPITMPYMPDSKSIEVYCEEFLTDRKNGDFDTLGILYAIMPDGERMDIYRYFKESYSDDGWDGWDEIDELKYNERKAQHFERISREKTEERRD